MDCRGMEGDTAKSKLLAGDDGHYPSSNSTHEIASEGRFRLVRGCRDLPKFGATRAAHRGLKFQGKLADIAGPSRSLLHRCHFGGQESRIEQNHCARVESTDYETPIHLCRMQINSILKQSIDRHDAFSGPDTWTYYAPTCVDEDTADVVPAISRPQRSAMSERRKNPRAWQ